MPAKLGTAAIFLACCLSPTPALAHTPFKDPALAIHCAALFDITAAAFNKAGVSPASAKSYQNLRLVALSEAMKLGPYSAEAVATVMETDIVRLRGPTFDDSIRAHQALAEKTKADVTQCLAAML